LPREFLASFLAFPCFLGTLPAVGAVVVVAAAGSIAFAVVDQILGEGFFREKGVTCVPLDGGSSYVNRQKREDTSAVRYNVNLVQI
jgi:hypothetical protein